MSKRISFKKYRNQLKADLDRHIATGAKSRWKVMFLNQGWWATCHYRTFCFLYSHLGKTIFRILLSPLYQISFKMVQIITGISLPVGMNIGEGLYIAHYGPLIVSSETIIGENCNLACQIVIGYGKSKGAFGHPVIGNRVFIGPGAKIFGPIIIDDDAAIGANAVVTSDVPAGAVVVGIPAKVVSFHGSFDYIKYPGMETDPKRIVAMKNALEKQAKHGNQLA